MPFENGIQELGSLDGGDGIWGSFGNKVGSWVLELRGIWPRGQALCRATGSSPEQEPGAGRRDLHLQSLGRTGNAEMSLLFPPPGQITRHKKCFTGYEVSYSHV